MTTPSVPSNPPALSSDVESLPLCEGCSRPMRPIGTKKGDYPKGVVRLMAKDRCATCYRRNRRDNLESHSIWSGDGSREQRDKSAASSPCVLVRVDLTPDTYKALRRANIDISGTLSNLADKVAAKVVA